jgi:hypothetical protein
MEILDFIKTNIFWIIFGILSTIFLFVLVKLIGFVKRGSKIKKANAEVKPKIISEIKPEIKKEEPKKEEVKPRVIELQKIPAKKPAYYDIPAISKPMKAEKKEIIQIPKKIITYSERENLNEKTLKEEIKKLKTEIREKEKENNRKTIVLEKEAMPAKKVKKETSKKTKKKVAKKKR